MTADLVAIERFVRSEANAIADPCAIATGVPIGLDDMGLVKSVTVRPAAPATAGVEVALELRLTSPECLYAVYFERELRGRLVGQHGIASIAVEWGSPFEWSPELMAPSARAALAARRQAIIDLRAQAGVTSGTARPPAPSGR